MKKLIILTFSVLAVLTAYTKETKQPLSQVELLQQVFGNLVDTTRTVMDGYDEYRAFADSLLYHVETVKERNVRVGARCIAQEIISSMIEESEFISSEEVAFFMDTLLDPYFLVQNSWHVDTIDDGYWLTCENIILHPQQTKVTELNVHIRKEGVFVLIDFPWDAVSNPSIAFLDEEYNLVDTVRFDSKTENVSIVNRNENENMRMLLCQDCFDVMLRQSYMWVEYNSDDPNMDKDTQMVQQLIPLWHFQSTIFTLL